jgi:hypothetical protein
MDQIEFDLQSALRSDVAGQKRTGSGKQFVFLRGEFAYKGPYQNGGKYLNVLSRTKFFNEWKTPCVVKAVDTINSKDGMFIRFPNLMLGKQLQHEPHKESFSNYSYNILVNPPIYDIGHAMLTHNWIPSEAEDLVLALCHFNVLGIGDTNVRNALVDPETHKFYLVDYDENLGTDRDDEVFYFSMAPAKKFLWYERTSIFYDKVADRLLTLLELSIADVTRDRINRAVSLLRKFASKPLPLTLSIQSPNVESPIGQMVWKGIRGSGSKTFSGIDLDIAKSALQKYIRRNIPEKSLLAAVELFRLREIGGDPGVSNMYNRLAIIAAEDIGVANLSLVLTVIKTVESGDRDISRLMAMVQLLSASSKTRIMSQAWRAYCTVEGRAIAGNLGLPLDSAFTPDDMKYIEQYKNCDLFLASDPESLRPYILIFCKRLIEKNFNAFSWAYFYMVVSAEVNLAKRRKFIKDPRNNNTGKADILLWRALGKVLAPEIHDILVEAYFNHTESRPFLQLAITIAMYGIKYETYDLMPMVNIWFNHPALQQMLSGRTKLTVDDFVIDKHTQEGRSNGKTAIDFVREGSMVSPQHETYRDELLEKIYNTR